MGRASTAEHLPVFWTNEQFERMRELGWLAGREAELIAGEVLVREGPHALTERRWTRDEYYQMLDLGWFQDRRVELIGGEVLEMPAQKNLHAMGIGLTEKALELAFRPNHWVRVQMSLDLSPLSIPDPDLAVVPGIFVLRIRTPIPRPALLVVEVSETTLAFDRNAKGSLYAAAGLHEYWIVNLVQRQLEVHRAPGADPAALHGASYWDRAILDPVDSVAPLAAPQSRSLVADLLP